MTGTCNEVVYAPLCTDSEGSGSQGDVETKTTYESSYVASPNVCQSQQWERVCNRGTWEPWTVERNSGDTVWNAIATLGECSGSNDRLNYCFYSSTTHAACKSLCEDDSRCDVFAVRSSSSECLVHFENNDILDQNDCPGTANSFYDGYSGNFPATTGTGDSNWQCYQVQYT